MSPPSGSLLRPIREDLRLDDVDSPPGSGRAKGQSERKPRSSPPDSLQPGPLTFVFSSPVL